MAEINPQHPLIAALAGLLGGGGLAALVARLIPSRKETLDDATAYRAELRAEIAQLQTRQDVLERAVEKWQEAYWKLYADHQTLKGEHATLQREMRETKARLGLVERPDAEKPPA